MEKRLSEEDLIPLCCLTGIRFSIATQDDIENSCAVQIDSSSEVTDPRLGLPNPSATCLTCGATNMKYCEGHFGRINLVSTVLNPHFLPEITKILNKICPGCKSIRRENRVKMPVDQQADCNHCNGTYPRMKFKVSSAEDFNKSSIVAEVCAERRSKEISETYWKFLPTDPHLEECSANTKKRVLSHAQVHFLIKDLDSNFLKKFILNPESMYVNCFPVTPNRHRVKEFVHGVSNERRLTFDKLTSGYKRVVGFRGIANELGSRVYETFKASKLYSGQSSKDDRIMPQQEKTDCPSQVSGSKWVKEVVLAKRSDNCFRMVVRGDPKIKLTEIGVPSHIAERMLVPEILNRRNLKKLGEHWNLSLFEEGAIFVKKEHAIVRVRPTDKLLIGDTIYRPMCDGDTVLVNRPPSIHQHSMISLSAKVLQTSSVLSLNPLCCSPFRGDFDGDCLHGYVPQSIDTRSELKDLVALDKQLFNGQSGKSLLSLSHDSLTAACLMLDDTCVVDLYNKQQLEMLCPDPPKLFPAIIKAPSINVSTPTWTGKQVFNMILPRGFNYSFEPSGVLVENGLLISASSNGSSWLSNNADGNLFHSLAKRFGGEVLETLYTAQDVLCQWLSTIGLSVSILDLSLAADPRSRENLMKEVLSGLEEAERACAYQQLLNRSERFVDLPRLSSLSDQAEQLCLERQTSAAASQASVEAFKRVFRDVSTLAFKYAERDNSVLAMMKSGSKGNIMKLVQQSMCLGAVSSLTPLSFRFPRELSCAGWNDHKLVSSRETYAKYVPFGVVKSSFLTGLNPLESFAHSVTTRDSSFSDNAQLPGTLTRKLMFFMRDIYMAYDGTVRSAYGNQLVQLSYGTNNVGDVDRAVAGHPVGVLAGCALSEAAYSALDQPVSLLETSPLLNLKNALECGSRKSTGDQTMSLYLSGKLGRLRHGFELGALEVKGHLERVLLKDVTSSVAIIFTPRSSGKNRLSPWVCHFHVLKNAMTKRRLNVELIINSMYQRCSSATKKSKVVLPNMLITSKSCTVSDDEDDDTYCISVAVSESSSDSTVELKTIQSSVIPYLLGTFVKGFQEIKQVDILWKDWESKSTAPNHCGELYLRVTMLGQRGRRSRTLWSVLMDNCLPIMDLIDWSRSRPENVNEFCATYGMGAGFKHFLNNLESAVLDVGKSVLPQHLILVTNSLSATGEFVGLNSKGFAQQKDHSSSASPFVQACFSTPANCFIKAAKNEVIDGLEGSIEALSWGKIPPLGTGAQFELLYSGKGHEIDKPKDVFELLRQCTSSEEPNSVQKPEAENHLTVNFAQLLCNKYKRYSSKGKDKLGITKEMLKKLFKVKDIWNLNYALNNILLGCQINSNLDELEYSTVMMALCFHPKMDLKVGAGVKSIKVANHPKHPSSRCFMLVREDGMMEDFSYRKCILSAFEILDPKEADNYKSKLSQNGHQN